MTDAGPSPRPKGKRHGGRPRAIEALVKPRRLDLQLPAAEPLSEDEVREMNEHLAFLRQFKGHLKLSLNAAEDLLINGARPPTDRGVCKHLLSKIDRKLVERTLAKEALKNDVHLRSRFLAGVVRLNPEVSVLLWYLETLAHVADKRESARAFALTVDRIDFETVSTAQMSILLDVVAKTFADHDRVQALFGLLESESFSRALSRALPSLPEPIAEMFGPLSSAHRLVIGGEPLPLDEREIDRVSRGIKEWLAAPDRVLRSYPIEVRERFAEMLMSELDLAAGMEIPRSLLDSLPHGGETYARLGLRRAEQLLLEHNDDGARALLSQIAEAHPKLTRVQRRLEALSWPRVGRVALRPESGPQSHGFRLVRGLWLDASCFVWARIAPKEEAARIASEAAIQESLLLPGVTHALGHQTADDGRAYVLLAPGGRPLDLAWLAKSSLADLLLLALEATRILRSLAQAGLELPDAHVSRFLLERGGAVGLRLADLDRVQKREPAAAAIAHGRLAAAFAQAILLDEEGEMREDVPSTIRARLRGAIPLPVLGKLLAEHAARSNDGVL
jgi:hypothetical protein